MTMRQDLATISEWIRPGSRVLDLGCGDGTLLGQLQEKRQVTGYGLEIDDDNVTRCIKAGVNVLQTDLDAGLSDFDAESFDYVIMTQTLQAVHYPDRLLEEMLRVGREGIVTFPNFAHWVNRVQLTLGGSMPMSRTLPNPWYSTPNIHLCTVSDFEKLCNERGIHILQRTMINQAGDCNFGNYLLPNLLGRTALYRFERR
ncbi:MAG: methionine biosynthesis protein MetW [Gammaproteobacteria bacterium]|nr:methionine biosynthesis protein MetW [Gammaproteobacteria bacterium]